MNLKFGLLAGAAVACAVMTGCKAPKAGAPAGKPVEQVPPAKQVEVAEVPGESAKEEVSATAGETAEAAGCKCAPGSVHDKPCACGAADCTCKVKEQETTEYRVKRGDVLSAICAKYNLKQSAVLAVNPGMNPNKLYAGSKIKLPGKVAVQDDTPSAKSKDAATAAAKPAKKSARATSYSGPVEEYKVQSGDSLGKIAISKGITVKCLKDMNGLSKDVILVGQKLKVPAAKVEAAEAPAAKPVEKKEPAAAPAEQKPEEAPAAAPAPAQEPPAEQAEAVPPVEQVNDAVKSLEETAPATHTVKEDEDIVSIAIKYNVSPSSILDLNDLKNTDIPVPGQVLKLPKDAKLQ